MTDGRPMAKTPETTAALRRPPLPKWPKRHDGLRVCPWCGEAVAYRLKDGRVDPRRRWHTECAALYQVASFPNVAASHVWRRDGGVCRSCGLQAGGLRSRRWVVDHIVPLWSVDRSAPWSEIRRYWLIDNMQTLCCRCHAAKTKREAAERAKLRKERDAAHRVAHLPPSPSAKGKRKAASAVGGSPVVSCGRPM